MGNTNTWKDQPEEVVAILLSYYQELFFTTTPVSSNATLTHIPYVLTEEINSILIVDFLESEVILALKQMAPLKAPGFDRMPPLFYQQFWQVVNHDVTHFFLSWLNSSTLPYPLNDTFITLIPKIKNPKFADDFCAISFCNVLYKVFPKALANRLKKLLPSIITKHQFAFTKDHLITDKL